MMYRFFRLKPLPILIYLLPIPTKTYSLSSIICLLKYISTCCLYCHNMCALVLNLAYSRVKIKCFLFNFLLFSFIFFVFIPIFFLMILCPIIYFVYYYRCTNFLPIVKLCKVFKSYLLVAINGLIIIILTNLILVLTLLLNY